MLWERILKHGLISWWSKFHFNFCNFCWVNTTHEKVICPKFGVCNACRYLLNVSYMLARVGLERERHFFWLWVSTFSVWTCFDTLISDSKLWSCVPQYTDTIWFGLSFCFLVRLYLKIKKLIKYTPHNFKLTSSSLVIFKWAENFFYKFKHCFLNLSFNFDLS